MSQLLTPISGRLPTEPEQRRNALQALLVISPIGGLLFLGLNLRLGADLLSVLSALLVLGSLALVLPLRRGLPVEWLGLTYLGLLYPTILVAMAQPGLHPGAASSMPMLPVLSYLLLKVALALPATALALVGAAGAYMAGVDAAPHRLEALVVAHIAMPTLALFVVCHFYARSRTRSARQMLERVFRDPLTGLWNRDKLDIEFEREARRSRRTGAAVTLLLLDLDDFKALNDRHGHDAGDAVLVTFAGILHARLREIDVACRIGGEEFAIVLPHTDRSGGATLAEHLREAVATTATTHGARRIHATVSIGVAELGPDGSDWGSLYRAADSRLYASKAAGRDTVVTGDPGAGDHVPGAAASGR